MVVFNRYFLIVGLIFSIENVSGYYVNIESNGPAVIGANITFVAKLFNDDGSEPSGSFRFDWEDNALPQHYGNTRGGTQSKWVVSFPFPTYSPGPYEVQVEVYKHFLFDIVITSKRTSFDLTSLLNGKMILTQGNRTMTNNFVSNAKPVSHKIALKDTDLDFLSKNATSISTYWFVDCIYYGQTSNYEFQFNYTDLGKEHSVEALVVASYEPIITTTVPPETTTVTTTTASPNTTTSTTTPTTTTTTTTTTSTTTKTTAPPSHNKKLLSNKTMDYPYVCLNSTSVPPDPKKTYGYFHQNMTVKAPITNVKADGTTWLQRDDVLNLQVQWEGSSRFGYCLKYTAGLYNVTGNETCEYEYIIKNSSLKVIHYFPVLGNYTILIIISNDVSKEIFPIAINIYEVTRQAQLSVIVIPVVCSFLAVILIVFGVAYYMQSRTRFVVEVADFNFGQAENLEYKTFRERLKESIQGAGYTCPDEHLWTPANSNGSRNEYGRMDS